MNSCLYKARVMHHRLSPKKHRFHYSVFMFYIDLDELSLLRKKLLLFSHNRFNVFSFKDKEHLQLPAGRPDTSKGIKQQILDYLALNGATEIPEKILLLTNTSILGYNFNPVSFYYCFGATGKPLYCIAEVSNTFREMKPYFMGADCFEREAFHLNTLKYFYVSPFITHDASFDFNLAVPGDKLNIRIDDMKEGERFFISTLTGTKKTLTNTRLFWYFIRFPFLTLRIMGLIHWQAIRLWTKKIKFYRKTENEDLQRGIYRKYR